MFPLMYGTLHTTTVRILQRDNYQTKLNYRKDEGTKWADKMLQCVSLNKGEESNF